MTGTVKISSSTPCQNHGITDHLRAPTVAATSPPWPPAAPGPSPGPGDRRGPGTRGGRARDGQADADHQSRVDARGAWASRSPRVTVGDPLRMIRVPVRYVRL